ncbi:MAG: protease SohB [Gammaproteobacteria bacterium]|jgi:serine protease SohB
MSLSGFFSEYGLFVVQLLTAVALLALIVGIIVVINRRGSEAIGAITVEKLNDKFDEMRDTVNAVLLDKKALRRQRKERRKQEKQSAKIEDKTRGRVYVVDFKGDIHASATASLREEISAILAVADAGETVLLRLENAGGAVHEHGLAASQLLRLKEHGLRLVVAVDKVAASGGYLMACVADSILSAPFAIVGSIGVLVQLPNLHRWLESKGIDYEQVTAGRFKRTLTVFGENTDEARQKVRSELEDIHALFKQQIAEYRPQVEIEAVATGEHWYGTRALELKLVDELRTSDEYLRERIAEADVYRFEFKRKKTLPERLMATAQALLTP